MRMTPEEFIAIRESMDPPVRVVGVNGHIFDADLQRKLLAADVP